MLGLPDLLALCPEANIYKFPSRSTAPASSIPSLSGDAATEAKIADITAADIADGMRRLPAEVRQKLIPIAEGQVFEVDGATLTAHHTPGHTPDHTSFLLREEGALFTGDAVLGHGTAVFEDLGVYMASLEKMGKLFGGLKGRAYPAHGAVIEDGAGKVEEYIAHRRQREREVWEAVKEAKKEGITVRDVVKVVYKDVREELHQAAEGGVVLVLRKMEGEGKVRSVGGKWVILGEEEKDGTRESL